MPETITKNYGINLDLERAQQSLEDWKFGAVTSVPCLYSVPAMLREKFLPKGEVQRTDRDDMSDCATRAPINKLATKFTYGYQKNLIKLPGNRAFLEKWFVRDGVIDFSDAFNAILSGTTRDGNSMKAPLESIRKDGLIPKHMLPLEKGMTFDEYHNPKRITKQMRDIGQEFARRFTINYEQVFESNFGEALKEDMLCVASHAWSFPENGVYPRTDNPINHEYILWNLPKFRAFDNYLDEGREGDFIKQLAPNYDFFEYGYRVFVSGENDVDAVIRDTLTLIEKLKKILAELLSKIEYVPPPKPVPNPTPKEVLAIAMAKAIEKYEDYVLPGGRYRDGKVAPQGSVSFRTKNPGNARFYTGGYLPKYGKVIESDIGKDLARGVRGFAIFETYELGFLYLKNLILSKAKANPNWNLMDFFKVYAPAEDNNNPTRYAQFVAKEMGVNVDTWRINALL